VHRQVRAIPPPNLPRRTPIRHPDRKARNRAESLVFQRPIIRIPDQVRVGIRDGWRHSMACGGPFHIPDFALPHLPHPRHGRGLARPPTGAQANHDPDLRRRGGWPGQAAAMTSWGLVAPDMDRRRACHVTTPFPQGAAPDLIRRPGHARTSPLGNRAAPHPSRGSRIESAHFGWRSIFIA